MMKEIEMEAIEAVIGIRKKTAKANETDWEQRPCEMAKKHYRGRFNCTITTFKQNARRAVECADILIAELRKEK